MKEPYENCILFLLKQFSQLWLLSVYAAVFVVTVTGRDGQDTRRVVWMSLRCDLWSLETSSDLSVVKDCGAHSEDSFFLYVGYAYFLKRRRLNSCRMYDMHSTYVFLHQFDVPMAKVPPNSGGIIPDWLPNLFFGGILKRRSLNGGNGETAKRLGVLDVHLRCGV